MTGDTDRLRRRLRYLLEMDAEPATAYPLRMRLARVVSEIDAALDDRLSEGEAEASWLASALALRDLSQFIVQPSEPFDGKWEAEWVKARGYAARMLDELPV
jgi:hypothetical protein